jgi:hypothetical protein
MSTRGLFGFVIDGKVKASYNHSDSYPSWLGTEMGQDILKLKDLPDIKDKVRGIVMLDKSVKKNDQAILKALRDKIGFDKDSKDEEMDLYNLLHDNQGDLARCIEVGFMLNEEDFALDSLFCEWGYLWNLDDNVLEFYRGYQKRKHKKGRFSNSAKNEDGYYGIALVKSVVIDDKFKETIEALIPKLEAEER